MSHSATLSIKLCDEGPIGFKRVLVLRKIKLRTRSAQYISRCRRLTELVFLFTSLWSQKCKIEGQKCKIAGQKCKIPTKLWLHKVKKNEYLNQPSFNQNQREYLSDRYWFRQIRSPSRWTVIINVSH